MKEPNKWWNNPSAFPTKKLYLDLSKPAVAGEDGVVYRFEFLTEERAAGTGAESWFPVSRIFAMPEPYDVMTYLSERGLGSTPEAVRTLGRLHKAVHIDPIIAFYEENSQDIEKVLNIFIRTNSGGTVLSYSDLLLSIATAQWDERDARSEIHTLVDELNDIRLGFNFSKDFVLKAGLMLSDVASVGFRVENFNRKNMAILEENWAKIADALKLTAELAGLWGLSRDTIRADSALLPVAYYLHRRGADRSYLTSKAEAADRLVIKRWIIRALVKPGVWGSGLDVLLTALREVLRGDLSAGFPAAGLEAAMRARGRRLSLLGRRLSSSQTSNTATAMSSHF